MAKETTLTIRLTSAEKRELLKQASSENRSMASYIINKLKLKGRTEMELKDLYGEHILTGVSFGEIEITEGYHKGEKCNTVDFIIDGKVYSAVEDPDDGYRSSMKEILEGRECDIQNTFPPLAVIGVEMPDGKYEKNDGLDFIDKVTGKIVMSIGTENIDDYYPSFVSRIYPENMAHNAVT